jgi:ribosomal-protein-alanine N-acetyltransferase
VIHGFLIARITGEECELENVAVAEGQRRSGIGAGVIRALTDSVSGRSVTRIFLEVRESNTAARARYEKCEFQISGRRKSYYKDLAEDAVLYIRVP